MPHLWLLVFAICAAASILVYNHLLVLDANTMQSEVDHRSSAKLDAIRAIFIQHLDAMMTIAVFLENKSPKYQPLQVNRALGFVRPMIDVHPDELIAAAIAPFPAPNSIHVVNRKGTERLDPPLDRQWLVKARPGKLLVRLRENAAHDWLMRASIVLGSQLRPSYLISDWDVAGTLKIAIADTQPAGLDVEVGSIENGKFIHIFQHESRLRKDIDEGKGKVLRWQGIFSLNGIDWEVRTRFIPSVQHQLTSSDPVWILIFSIMLSLMLAYLTYNRSRYNKRLYWEVAQRTQQLDDEKQTLASVIDHANEAILISNAQGDILRANPAACTMFGYSPEDWQALGVHALVPQKVFEKHGQQHIAKEISGETHYIIGKEREVSGQRKDGKEFPCNLAVNTFVFEGETHLSIILRDLTARKQSEAAFQTLIKSIIGHAGQCFFEQTVIQMATWLNVECVIISELIDEDHVRSLAMVKDGALVDTHSYALTGTPCFNATKGFCFYRENICKLFPYDGDLKDMEAESYVGAALHDENGTPIGILCAIGRKSMTLPDKAREVLEIIAARAEVELQRTRAEAELQKLSNAIKQAGESVMVTDSDGMIEYVNPAFTTLTGYTADEATGQMARLFFNVGNHDGLDKDVWKVIKSGNTWHGKVIDQKKDGGCYPAMLTVSPVFDQSGQTTEITNFVAVYADLSELENMEKQFHQAQKMDALGTLVGGIAHDFNNMLSSMTGNLYLAKNKLQDRPDVVQRLGRVEKQAMLSADMIRQLLTFARKDEVSMKKFPLAPFIKESLKFLTTSVPENIAIHQNICTESLPVEGDGTQLHQVLMNLVTNAIHALEGEGDACITIALELFDADDAFIENREGITTGSYAHLSVQDTGCGIPEHQIDHLFEPFFTTKEQGKGTGLGLAMVFGAIQSHHGLIEVKSIEGMGTTFHIYLPLLAQQDLNVVSSQQQEIAVSHGETILLVDDQQHIIETGREVLESLGYQVLTASDGKQAVDIFQTQAEQIDLCLIDVVMPVMGGNQAAEAIQQIKPDIKIIFSTGYDKNIQTDMTDKIVISKPFSIVELSHLIRQQFDS